MIFIGGENMKYLVTGATGFVGKSIVKELKKRGVDVTALVRKSSNLEYLVNENIPYVYGDLTDFDSLKKAFKNHNVVIHAAGLVTDWGKKADYIKTNYYGTKNLLEACVATNIRRVLHVSTVSVFNAQTDQPINEDTPWNERIPGWYSKSKHMAEELVRDYMQKQRLDITIVYPSWIYGEGDQHFVPEIIQALRTGKMLFFRDQGNHVIEIVYVGNLVEAIVLILSNDQTIGKSFILSDKPKITFREFVNTIAGRIGAKEVNFTVPYPIAYSAAFIMESLFHMFNIKKRPFLTRSSVLFLGNNIIYDTSNLQSIGFKQPYDFKEAIERSLHILENGTNH
jgi:nucleoside-diphosphate-sugar epimerase